MSANGTDAPVPGFRPVRTGRSGRFGNPPSMPGGGDGPQAGTGAILRWMLSRRTDWPRRVPDAPRFPPPGRAPPDRLAVTFIGHATFLIQIGGVSVLTDPVWSHRASPVPGIGPVRVRPPGQPIEALPGVDLVLVSHCHYDHLDRPSLRRIARRFRPACATPIGNAALIAGAGLPGAVELGWWGSATIAGVRVTAVPARHFSARTGLDRDRRLWSGFVLEAGGARVLFAGDTADGVHFAAIGDRFGPFDLALLPIGAYAPRALMRAHHVDPAGAVAAHRALGAVRSLGMHFGTFRGLTDEPIDEPERLLAEAARDAGLDRGAFTAPAFGETLAFPAGGGPPAP